jgi:hypothetical protein
MWCSMSVLACPRDVIERQLAQLELNLYIGKL